MLPGAPWVQVKRLTWTQGPASSWGMEEHLSPTEAARRLGVTVKALKTYERHGLLAPLRTGNGWRVYGAAEVVRVHEVLALKALGLSLAGIAALLRGQATDLDRVLALQAAVLRERRAAADGALARIGEVRRRLAAGHAVAVADILEIEAAPPRAADWGERLRRHYAARIAPEALDRLTAAPVADWMSLVDELKTLCDGGVDPGCDAAQDFMKRWIAAAEGTAPGEPALRLAAYDAWTAALDDPETAPHLPFGQRETAYLQRLGAAFAAANGVRSASA